MDTSIKASLLRTPWLSIWKSEMLKYISLWYEVVENASLNASISADFPQLFSPIIALTPLPKASSSLRDWKNLLTAKIEELVEQGTISIHKSRNINDIIKLKTRIKVNRKTYSTEFLDNPLQIYFEKRTTKGTTFSSVHGVKGETFDATLFMIESNTGNTVTPSFLNSGRLDDELMRIAYVAMTRPRKLLVASIPKQKSNNNLNRFPTELWDYEEIWKLTCFRARYTH